MIRYALKCARGHQFESWFQSAAAYESLEGSGRLECAVCGSGEVAKALMAPRVAAAAEAEPGEGARPPAPVPDAQRALAALRRHVEENATYVGGKFADEARSMYLGAAEERAIYGEATGAEAKALIEDGIPVAPLPFLPTRKAN